MRDREWEFYEAMTRWFSIRASCSACCLSVNLFKRSKELRWAFTQSFGLFLCRFRALNIFVSTSWNWTTFCPKRKSHFWNFFFVLKFAIEEEQKTIKFLAHLKIRNTCQFAVRSHFKLIEKPTLSSKRFLCRRGNSFSIQFVLNSILLHIFIVCVLNDVRSWENEKQELSNLRNQVDFDWWFS